MQEKVTNNFGGCNKLCFITVLFTCFCCCVIVFVYSVCCLFIIYLLFVYSVCCLFTVFVYFVYRVCCLFIVFVVCLFRCALPTQKHLVSIISACFKALSLIITRIPTSHLLPASLLAVVFNGVPVGGNGVRDAPEGEGGLAVRVACVVGVGRLVECVVRWWREVVRWCEWWKCFVCDVLGSLEAVAECPAELCELGGREGGRDGGTEGGRRGGRWRSEKEGLDGKVCNTRRFYYLW